MSGANWREQNQRLQDIIQKLQAQDLDLDETTKLYQEALEVIQKLEDYLKKAENKIKNIK